MRAALFIATLSLALWCVILSVTLALAFHNQPASAWFGGASFILCVVALTIYAFPPTP